MADSAGKNARANFLPGRAWAGGPPGDGQPPNQQFGMPNQLTPQVSNNQPSTKQPIRKGKKIALGVGIGLLVLALVLAGVVFFKRQQEAKRWHIDAPEPVVPGVEFHPLVDPGRWLAEGYEAGGTPREYAGQLLGYDAKSQTYVIRDERYDLVGFDLISGAEKWRTAVNSCRHAVSGRIVCTEPGKILELNYQDGQLQPIIRQPPKDYLRDYLGRRDGVDFFLFSETNYTVLAVSAGRIVWEQNLGAEPWKCELLYDKIGCSSAAKLSVLNIASGSIEHKVSGSFNRINWLSDGYISESRDGEEWSHVYDFDGNDLGRAYPGSVAPKGIYAAIDKNRHDGILVDAEGRALVTGDSMEQKFRSSGKTIDLTWFTSATPDGKIFLGNSANWLTIFDAAGNEIQHVEGISNIEVRHNLISYLQDGKHFILIPKQ